MKNVVCFLLFLNSILLIKSDVITNGFPEGYSECYDETDKLETHECILFKIKSKNAKGLLDHDEINLQVRQDYYWHPQKRIRRECRALPEDEWLQLVDAINTLKNDRSLKPSVYDVFAAYHTNETIHTVHFGPGFYGWHRCFILKFEELLRKINPNITLCYWDSRLDHVMDHPPDSIMFSDRFYGNMNGPVTSGPFANWITINNNRLHRKMDYGGELITPENINSVLSKRRHSQIVTPTADADGNFEFMHNKVHAFIGGQMNNFNLSSCDPIFFFHHVFTDFIWELFCKNLRDRGIDPQDDYVMVSNNNHHPDRVMDHLFPLTNRDGYSHYFSSNIYEYEGPASLENDCLGSPFLKWDEEKNTCRSIEMYEQPREVEPLKRIETNHLSKPQHDVTILKGEENIDKYVVLPVKLVFKKGIHKSVISKSIADCGEFDNDPDLCTQTVAVVQSNGLSYRGIYKNYIVNEVLIPQWTFAYVGIKDPAIDGVSKAYVTVADKAGNPCQAYCLSEKEDKYEECPGFITVTNSDPKMYSETIDDIKASGFHFNPLEIDVIDRRVKLAFLCY